MLMNTYPMAAIKARPRKTNTRRKVRVSYNAITAHLNIGKGRAGDEGFMHITLKDD